MEMTDEQMEFEAQQMEAFFGGGNKNAGQIVETKTGLVGRTYDHESLINGKVRVYTNKGKLLCDPTTLKLKGFID
jgi:hypothetical protein